MTYITKTLVPVMFSFFIMGYVDIVGIATNYIRQDLNLPNSVANFLPLTIFIWFAILAIPTGALMNRIGRKKTVITSNIFTFFGLLIPFLSYNFNTFIIAFSLLGIGNTMLQVSLNPLVSDIVNTKKLTSMLTLGQFIKATAAFITPIISAWLSLKYGLWTYILPIYATIVIIVTFWLFYTSINEKESITDNRQVHQIFKLFSDKTLILLFTGILLIVGIDVGMNISVPNILKDRCGFILEKASIGTSVYFAARTIGSLLGSIILMKATTEKIFFYSMLSAVIGFSLLLFSGFSEFTIYLFTIIIGLSCANIFSIIFSLAIQHRPERANEISGLMIMGVAGGGIFPFIMGILIDNWGLEAGLYVILLCCILIFAMSFKFLLSTLK